MPAARRQTRLAKCHFGVPLTCRDPCDPPQINFHYFKEGTDTKSNPTEAATATERLVGRDKVVALLGAPVSSVFRANHTTAFARHSWPTYQRLGCGRGATHNHFRPAAFIKSPRRPNLAGVWQGRETRGAFRPWP